jgi:uncharacterized SAM-binding protein YcdF (DUF218 family)
MDRKLMSKFMIFIALFVYVFSIEPTKDIILKPLEKRYEPINKEQLSEGDVYILLGGGISEDAPLSFGQEGIPSEVSMMRMVEVVRLYKKDRKKIIVSGGKTPGKSVSEASVYKKFLVDMGIEQEDIIMEEESRTTAENSIMTKKIIDDYGFKCGVLVTSASHMPRAIRSFERKEIKVVTAPCGYAVNYGSYKIQSFLPKASNIELITRGLWEYVGYIYYAIKRV